MKAWIRGTWVLAAKDLRNLFLSPLFYVVTGLCTIVWTLVYFLSLQEFASQATMSQFGGPQGGPNLHFVVFAKHVSIVNLVMIFAVSALSMRLFTEEKRSGTMPLLLTSPVSATQITLGKFKAGVAAAWALLAISAVYPVSLAVYSSIEWGPLATSYIGLMLVVACYVGVGMFASSLTDNTVVSVIMALILNVLLWFVGALSEAAPGGAANAVFEHLNFGAHFVNFIKGSLSVASIVFFASVMALAVFLTHRVVESARWR